MNNPTLALAFRGGNPASAPSPASQKIGLKGKLIRIIFLVGTLPLLLAMAISYIEGNKSLKSVIGSSFQALAYETATKIDFLMREEAHNNKHLANHPTLVLSVKAHNDAMEALPREKVEQLATDAAKAWGAGDETIQSAILKNAASRILMSTLSREPRTQVHTHAFFITDARGTLVASINSRPDYLNTMRPAWKKTIASKDDWVYLGPLEQDPHSRDHVFEIAVPILGADGKPLAVIHRVYNAKKFFSSYIEPILFGRTGHVMLIDSQGIVLDCPILPTGFRLADPQLVAGVTGVEAGWVEALRDGHGGDTVSIIGHAPLRETIALTGPSGSPHWHSFAWQASDEVFSPMKKLLISISAAGLFSLTLIVLLGSVAANKVVRPILELQQVAARIGRGESVEPIRIRTGDEIQTLAEEINTMNALIRQSLIGLKTLVREKTQEVLYLKEYTEKVLIGLPDPLLMFDQRLRVEYANAAVEHLAGTPSSGFVGKTLTEAGLVPAEPWTMLAEDLRRFAESGKASATTDERRSTTPLHDPLVPQKEIPVEELKTVAFGDRYFVYRFFQVTIHAGEQSRIGLILKDVTEEKRLQDQLALAEKLSGLGRFSAGIAHEINNPLFSVLGYTEAILEESNPEKIRGFAGKILDRARHIAAVVRNLSGYARDSRGQFKDVNVNERIDAAIEIALMASYSNDVLVEKKYTHLSPLKARPEEILQIFINIVVNAVQAMQGKGQINIHSEQADGNIMVRIRDSGPGIHSGHLTKVFDPFFTTKEQGQGSGLGLNIVHRLVNQYGGTVEVASPPGQGALFTITLPLRN